MKSEMDTSRKKEVVARRRMEWVDLYACGFSLADIAKMYGFHHSSVIAQLERAGIERRDQRRGTVAFYENLQKKWLMWGDMYSAGKTAEEIAREYGVHGATVRRALGEIGVERRVGRSRGVATRPEHIKARMEYLESRNLKSSARIERMMELACPKRRRFAA